MLALDQRGHGDSQWAPPYTTERYVADLEAFADALRLAPVLLIGIVVTNAIVLIAFVEQQRARGLPTREALIQSGRARARPILMTAVTTIFALIPLSLGLNEGALIAAELGTVVIGGLFTSTVLTLLVIPVVYSLVDEGRSRLRRRPATG